MSSRYYVARPPSKWPGVCEVPDGQTDHCFHHLKWPERNTFPMPFVGGKFHECIDPVTGWWVPMPDEDLLMDIGL